MSEKKQSRDEGTDRTIESIDTIRENILRIADEVAKVQPQFAQSISNLQLDYIQAVKSMIQTGFANQKQVLSALNIQQIPQVSEQIAKQFTELTTNVSRSVGVFNQLSLNALDAARENVKIYNRTVDAVTDFNDNLLKTWTSYRSAQQQQFYRA
jgi:BMFP domain-containing protein YqiC